MLGINHQVQKPNYETPVKIPLHKKYNEPILLQKTRIIMYQQLEKKQEQENTSKPIFQRKEQPNRTGLPNSLKDGIQRLSGYDMSDVKVHYNSSKPAQLNAHAYAQGTQIHLGAGQERHLPHEAWHVVQQKQGRVQPTMNFNGQAINDNAGLEKEADVMGGKALQMKPKENKSRAVVNSAALKKSGVKQGFGFVDNRPEAITQRKLQVMLNSKTRVNQVPQLQTVTQRQPIAKNTDLDDENFVEAVIREQVVPTTREFIFIEQQDQHLVIIPFENHGCEIHLHDSSNPVGSIVGNPRVTDDQGKTVRYSFGAGIAMHLMEETFSEEMGRWYATLNNRIYESKSERIGRKG